MAHFAIVGPAEAGHLLPIGSVGKELARRGHRVTVVAHPRAAPLAAQLDLPLCELPGGEPPDRLARLLWLAFAPFGAGWLVWLRARFCWAAHRLLDHGPRLLRQLAADAVLIDEIRPGAGTVAEHLGLPYVTVSSALMWHAEAGVPPASSAWDYREGRLARMRNRLGYAVWQWYFTPLLRVINRYRRAWNLPRFVRLDDTHSPWAHLAQSCVEFDFPRRELPDTFHYVGALGAHRQTNDPPFPWERLDGRPLIFASLGTVPDPTNLPVYPKIAAACAGLGGQLVMALGRWEGKHSAAREKLGSLPGDPLLVDYAPQLAMLERAALFITHAGLNSTLESLCRAVPMVAMPRSSDQPAVAARIERAGAGLRAPFRGGTVDDLRRTIGRVLSEEQFRRRARDLQRALLAIGGPSRAADIVEEIVAGRRPVRRLASGGTLRPVAVPRAGLVRSSPSEVY